ncbi:DNA polymerase III subunit gamma/tau [Basilea psittacipulmonis]|uniref:DNA polymerase III subunit gamma/tau n=1 Tax=Basilea psittacipulmonis TaxID=1472345 RepID=UPI000987846A|nr:DNA polymerase III subunit gamma/tau [Basilea psittacipulmonis]
MTYLALARKWRPKDFSSLVGQEHVVRALTNSLETGRLHHAWLFTGTRGVGKTTLSRILAKSLNCIKGVTASPCGVCEICKEIDEGRFIDYLEFDAASNRGVSEVEEILEQALYAPTQGRYKVLMIDEVHMLTNHAFNAMLKTLEEPPEHVKFILATTDPQKIPVTVLSRCLQFNLKQMPVEAIVPYLQNVLTQEGITFELPALRLLGKAAAGSMRDALSLTDQAIAYSSGNITQQSIQEMFGSIDQTYLAQFIKGLLEQDAHLLIQTAKDLLLRGFSYANTLEDLAELFSLIAVEQRLPGSTSESEPLREAIIEFAKVFPADALQLCYSVALHGRSELTISPDEYAGFVMTILRMLSLMESANIEKKNIDIPSHSLTTKEKVVSEQVVTASPATEPSMTSPVTQDVPVTQNAVSKATPSASPATKPSVTSPVTQDVPVTQNAASKPTPSASPVTEPSATSVVTQDVPVTQNAASKPTPSASPATEPSATSPVTQDVPVTQVLSSTEDNAVSSDSEGLNDVFMSAPTEMLDQWADSGDAFQDYPAQWDNESAYDVEQSNAHVQEQLIHMTPDSWVSITQSLPRNSFISELLRHSEWEKYQDKTIYIKANWESNQVKDTQQKLSTLLTEYFQTPLNVVLIHAEVEHTAHTKNVAARKAKQEKAVEWAKRSPIVRELIEQFNGELIESSIQVVGE